jgi:ribose transport system substrate-binding protein
VIPLRFFAATLLALAVSVRAAETLTIAVIPKGTTHEFWKSIHAGAVKAQRELEAAGTPVRLFWKGPLREDDRDQQIQVVENFTTRGVSGIVLAPLDAQALIAPVRAARSAGIPTVVIDSALNSDAPAAAVMTDNFKGGQLAADHLATLLGGRGRILLLRYAVGSASTEAREAGFLDALKKHPGLQLVSGDQYAGATRETAYQAAQNLLNRFGKDLGGVFCPCEPITITMTKALRELGQAGGRVKVVGFDAGTQSVADLKAGDVQGLIVQNPMQMGYLGVKTVVAKIRNQPVEAKVDTGITLVTPANQNDPEVLELLHPPLSKYLAD